jgi:hypothetical protein
MVFASVTCAHTAPLCGPTAPQTFADRVQEGLGDQPFWFTSAAARIPWEGKSGIAAREVLDHPEDMNRVVLPLAIQLAPDCARASRLVQKMRRYGVTEISGRGRYRADGVFEVDCVCKVKKLDPAAAAQASVLQVFP